MDYNKNYYAILGVMPDAEHVVIQAVYKALAKKYHPDKFPGPKEEANRLMSEINEAYEVLSNVDSRVEYDKNRTDESSDPDEFFKEDKGAGPQSEDPLLPDWEFALSYYPDLDSLEVRLRKISWKLAYAFKAYILEEKAFKSREKIAELMEHDFLKVYFGKNKNIINFAKSLIRSGKKDAAKELNKAIKIFGEDIDSEVVISIIKSKYNLVEKPKGSPTKNSNQKRDYKSDPSKVYYYQDFFEREPHAPVETYKDFIIFCGGTVDYKSYVLSGEWRVVFNGRTHVFQDGSLRKWVREDLLPLVVSEIA